MSVAGAARALRRACHRRQTVVTDILRRREGEKKKHFLSELFSWVFPAVSLAVSGSLTEYGEVKTDKY